MTQKRKIDMSAMLAIFLLPLLAGVLGQDETPADDSSAPVVRTVYPQFWFYDCQFFLCIRLVRRQPPSPQM